MKVETDPRYTCPRCQRTYHRVLMALSRKDNRTPICPACGVDEDSLIRAGNDPWPEWPLPFVEPEPIFGADDND